MTSGDPVFGWGAGCDPSDRRLCYVLAVTIAPSLGRVVTSRVIRPGAAEPSETDWAQRSPSERVAGAWLLTRLCLAWNRDPNDEPRLQRSVSRIQRAWR